MPIEITTSPALTQVKISGGCTIFDAADLRQQLLPLVTASTPVVVDLAEITEIDTAGLQVLLALQKQCALALFSRPSPAMQTALDLLNLNRCFSIEA